jgi:hypothetical protein
LELPGNGRAAWNFVGCARAIEWKWLDIRGIRLPVGELQGRKSLGKLGIRWKDDIKVDHKNGGVN